MILLRNFCILFGQLETHTPSSCQQLNYTFFRWFPVGGLSTPHRPHRCSPPATFPNLLVDVLWETHYVQRAIGSKWHGKKETVPKDLATPWFHVEFIEFMIIMNISYVSPKTNSLLEFTYGPTHNLLEFQVTSQSWSTTHRTTWRPCLGASKIRVSFQASQGLKRW